MRAGARHSPDKQGMDNMEAYAVVETGGKQYRVEAGQTFDIERLKAEAGTEVELAEVLAVSNGNEIKIGKPYVKGASVIATVNKQGRGSKIIIYKYEPKKHYHRKNGHRQPYTKLTITEIAG